MVHLNFRSVRAEDLARLRYVLRRMIIDYRRFGGTCPLRVHSSMLLSVSTQKISSFKR